MMVNLDHVLADIESRNPGAVWPAEASAYKLYAPPTYPGAIRRDAILQRVLDGSGARVILLQAPAGHGKSTALQQIKTEYETRSWITAWLTLDDADNDPGRFAIHVQALIDSVCSEEVAKVSNVDFVHPTRTARRADWALDRLARRGEPVALFLDELQTIRNPLFIAFFRDLFDRVPQNVRIFVGSRSLPELGLAKLLVSNLAIVLRVDDLRFSPEEVDRFFKSSKELDISSQEIGAVYRRTEGWPAALQLYRLTLSSVAVRNSLDELNTDSPRELAEYLTDNVLALQPPPMQEFLLRTSLLTRLNPELCDAITGREDSRQILIDLERSGLFIRSLDAAGRWFKYHGLFSTIMAENFGRVSKAAVLQVHSKAAQWYLAHSMYEEVVHHALKSGDVKLAADTLNIWASRLVASGQLMTVERWMEQIPTERILERTDLAIKVAYALIFLRRERRLCPILAFLRRLRHPGEVALTTSPRVALSMAATLEDDLVTAVKLVEPLVAIGAEHADFAAFEIGAASNVLAYRDLAAGEFDSARKHLALARTSNDRGGATFSGGYTLAIIGASLIFQGQLREALERFRQEMNESSAHLDSSFAGAALASCHMWALYEANDLDGVEALYARYHDSIAGSVIPDFIALAHIAMSRTFDARGRSDRVVQVLDEFERIGHDNGWNRLIAMADWERVRRALIAGDSERACAIEAHIVPAKFPLPDWWISLSEDLEGEALGRIRLAVHTLDAATASTRISLELQRQPRRIYRLIKLHLLDAILKQREGLNNAAHRSLRKAVQLAKSGRYVRCFIEEGSIPIQLLREAYQRIVGATSRDEAASDMSRGYLEELLAASGLDLNQVSKVAPQVQPLSEREQEMIAYLAGGASNKQMAECLFVSENTIKFHLKNIYSKLGVSNRLQAIVVARELGMLG